MRVPVVCDLDGVVWLGDDPIPGSAAAVASLREAGHRVLFATNFSFAPVEETERKLERVGIPARGDVVTSAQAAAVVVHPGERVLVCGGPGIVQAVEQRGAEVVTRGRIDAVIVGFHRTFDFDAMTRASSAVRAGARLIGTNDDATYPTPQGEIPGGGAILASVQVASGASAIIAGKPHQPMADLVRARLLTGGVEPGSDAIDGSLLDRMVMGMVMVGDRPSTDGLFARRLGCRYAQVWSGVMKANTSIEPHPDLTADDLAGVAELLLRER